MITDPEQEAEARKEKEKEQKRRRTRRDADLKWVMSSAPGRRFMWELLAECGIYRCSFNNSGSQTFFNEGMRNVGTMKLAQLMKVCPDDYLKMQSEAMEESRNERSSDAN